MSPSELLQLPREHVKQFCQLYLQAFRMQFWFAVIFAGVAGIASFAQAQIPSVDELRKVTDTAFKDYNTTTAVVRT